MKIEFLTAKKYFFPKNRDFFRRITLISIVSIFISVFLPLFVLGILNGFQQSMISKIISKDFHLQVYDTADSFFDYRDVIEHVEKNFNGARGFAFFEGGAIIMNQSIKTSVLIRGVPSDIHSFLSDFKMISGEWSLNKFSVILGSEMAKKLRLEVGDVATFYAKPLTRGKETEVFTSKKFKIAGIYKTGYDEIDSNLVFMDFDKARSFYNYEDRAWGVGFFLKDLKKIPQIKKEIKNMNAFFQIRDWEEANHNLLFSFKWEKTLMLIVLVIIIIATLFAVSISFNVVVSDRKKEIGMLKVMGLTPERITMIFLLKGLFLSLIGIVLGTVFSYFLLSYFKDFIVLVDTSFSFISENLSLISKESTYSGAFSFEWSLFDILVIFVLNVFSVLLATYFPVKRINRYAVSELIRNG